MDHIGSIGAGFLSKPFQINSLIEAVDRVTGQQAVGRVAGRQAAG